jgi:hypothetical protein
MLLIKVTMQETKTKISELSKKEVAMSTFTSPKVATLQRHA